MRNKYSFLWFLLGLGSPLQLFGSSLTMAELFSLVGAPLIIGAELPHMRRTGMMTFFSMAIVLILSCVMSCFVNHSPAPAILRGLAACCLFPCSIVVAHWLLRNDPSGFKWAVLASPLGMIINIFAFQAATELVAAQGGDVSETVINGPLFWIGRVSAFFSVPASGWYLRTPIAYSFCIPIGLALFAMLTTTSGRSAALGAIATSVLVLIGRKKRSSMRRLSRYFWPFIFCAIAGSVLLKSLYSYAAVNDWLGEAARKKYEDQTRHGSGVMSLLIGGRAESFVGLLACRDHPIFGCGPWPKDTNGYVFEFLSKYGTQEDYDNRYKYEQKMMQAGFGLRDWIPCHSMVTQFWCWYGIGGLVFVLYSMFVLLRFIRQDVYVVPQWYYWLACSMGTTFWNILFSPFASRFGFALLVVACLYARAIRRRRAQLPFEMLIEIDRHVRG